MSLYKIAVTLQPHQEEALNKLLNEDGLLLYHSLGSGKTLTALKAIEQYGGRGVFIAPASLRENVKKEIQKHKIKANVRVSSYAKPIEPSPDDVLVFDEAHRMGRLESNRSKYPELFEAKKKLFLTGTPVRNRPEEIIPIARGLGINMPRDTRKFKEDFIEEITVKPSIWARLRGVKPGKEERIKNKDKIKKLFAGKVHYYQAIKSNFPKTKEEIIEVPMSKLQEITYKQVLKENPSLAYKVKYGIPPNKTESKKMNAFLNAARQVANYAGAYNLSADERVDAPKIEKAVEEILRHKKRDPNFRGILYSYYLSSGINLVEKKLKEKGLRVVKFTGQLNDAERRKISQDFNAGKYDVLLVSKAGTEGLDLQGVKLIQILEPHWNEAQIKQVIGRGVRYKSHEHLPEKERVVKIQRFHAVPSKKWYERERKKGVDEYLYELAQKKEQLNYDFLSALREVGQTT